MMKRGFVVIWDPMLAPCPRCGWRHPEPPEQCPFDWHKRETPAGEGYRGCGIKAAIQIMFELL